MGKKGRRAHGEGTIYRRNSDGRWVARYYATDPTGKLKAVYRYRKSEKEALKALQQLTRQHDDGADLTADDPKLADFLARWLKDSARPSVRAKTYAGYESIVTYRIVPHLGHLKLSQLKPARIQSFYMTLADDGLSQYSVINTHRVLRKALDQAHRWGMILRSPVDLVDAPRAQKQEMQTLSAEQVGELLSSAAEDHLVGIYALAVSTGMRLGELLGLRWSDIDRPGRRLFVRRSLQRVPREGLQFAEPKTKKSRRTVALSQLALDALYEHRQRQVKDRLKFPGEWEHPDLVFTTEWGKPIDPGSVSKRFKKALQLAGLPSVRFHDLRHTAATLLLQADTHPKIVSEMLGHSTITLTLDTYSHVIPRCMRRPPARWTLSSAVRLEAVRCQIRCHISPESMVHLDSWRH